MTDELFAGRHDVADSGPERAPIDDGPAERTGRWVLHRAGIVNVWQYDRVEIRFAGGRALLRGKNGAGKSKALEVLLPFLLDGDTRSIDAAGRDRTTVGWLMTDGRDPGNHVGYVWLELRATDEDGHDRFCTLGAGLKSSTSTRQTTSWFWLTEEARVGAGLLLDVDGECLSLDRLKAQLGEQVTTSAAEHRRRVAHRLFGLRDEARYANLLHLLHRLRDPNIGNRIEAGELADVLRDALPPPSDAALEDGAERFDTLEQVRDQLERTERTASALARFMASYVGYAGTVLRGRARDVLDAVRRHRQAERESKERDAQRVEARLASDEADAAAQRLRDDERDAAAELEGLQQSDAYKQHLQLADRRTAVQAADAAARSAESEAAAARRGEEEAAGDLTAARGRVDSVVTQLRAGRDALVGVARAAGVDPIVVPGAPTAEDDEPVVSARRDATATALDVARGRARQAEAVRILARAALDAGRRAAEGDERVGRSELDLAQRVADADAGQERWAALSDAWRERLRAWPPDADELGVDLAPLRAVLLDGPADAGEVAEVATVAARVLAPPHEQARRAEAGAASALATAVAALEAKEAESSALAATAESVPEPGRYRAARRDPAQGAPFYELVDFVPGVADEVRAGLEAAVEAAGLLDAWVGADGLVSHPATRDVLVRPGLASLPDGTDDLRQVLVAAVPEASPVGAGTVTAILAAIGLGDHGDRPWVAPDGRWSLGPLRGAWTKTEGEYLGAGARRATRQRRLDALAAECAQLDVARAAAEDIHRRAGARRERFDGLAATLPSDREVTAAGSEVAVLERMVGEARARHDEDRRIAEAARTAAARALAEVRHAAAADNLPSEPEALDGVVVATAELIWRLQQLERGLADLASRAAEVAQRTERLDQRRAETEAAETRADQRRTAHRRGASSLAALEEAVGSTVDEVLGAIEATTARRDAARSGIPAADQQARARADDAVRAEERAAQATLETGRAADAVRAGAYRLDAALVLPGTARAALGRDVLGASDLVDGEAGDPAAAARLVLELAGTGDEVTDKVILNRYDELQDALAGGYDIAVDEDDGVKYFLVTDDAGRQPLPVVAARVESDAEAARGRLAASEREVIVRFLVGELGVELRERLLEAEDLVAATNTALAHVRTSHGKGARLEWKVDADDVDEARAARRLLLLSPRSEEEDAELQVALLALIGAQRDRDPTGSYLDHLRRALDYRDWHRFSVQVVDDARPGSLRTLSNRLGLSQGEQRVLSYLALFAAASASFDAIGGGGPRLLLLDDAFAKVDEPTHGRLLELLVDLDLDFMITSERLWGCFPSVPSLEIYEALREPTIPGVALVHFRWDGHQRHLVGM